MKIRLLLLTLSYLFARDTYAAEHSYRSFQPTQTTKHSSLLLLTAHQKSRQPNLLNGPYNQFWYQHCLTTHVKKTGENCRSVRLLLNLSSTGEIVLMKANVTAILNDPSPLLEITYTADLPERSSFIIPALFSRILDALDTEDTNWSTFFAAPVHTDELQQIGCIRHLEIESFGYNFARQKPVLFSVDHTRKIDYLKQNGILLKNTATIHLSPEQQY